MKKTDWAFRLAILSCFLEAIYCPTSTAAGNNADQGRALFVKNGCFECHGYVGQGSIMSGPALAPYPVPEEAMRSYVRNPSGQMPPYSPKILSDADLNLIHVFLSSLPASKQVTDIALLRPSNVGSSPSPTGLSSWSQDQSSELDLIHGANVFKTSCASCHGANAEGGVGPQLRGTGRSHSIDWIEKKIRSPAGMMPRLYPNVLNDDDVHNVAKYVMSIK